MYSEVSRKSRVIVWMARLAVTSERVVLVLGCIGSNRLLCGGGESHLGSYHSGRPSTAMSFADSDTQTTSVLWRYPISGCQSNMDLGICASKSCWTSFLGASSGIG